MIVAILRIILRRAGYSQEDNFDAIDLLLILCYFYQCDFKIHRLVKNYRMAGGHSQSGHRNFFQCHYDETFLTGALVMPVTKPITKPVIKPIVKEEQIWLFKNKSLCVFWVLLS